MAPDASQGLANPLCSCTALQSLRLRSKWLWVKTIGIPFWLVGEFTTHFRTYVSGWIWIFTGGKPGFWAFDPWPNRSRVIQGFGGSGGEGDFVRVRKTNGLEGWTKVNNLRLSEAEDGGSAVGFSDVRSVSDRAGEVFLDLGQ